MRRTHVLALALVMGVTSGARGEPFVTIPGAGGWAARGVLPGTELLGPRAPSWSTGGTYGPSGTDIVALHAALARRRGALGAQLTLTRLGTSFYDESRLALALGGCGPDALVIVADARAARAGDARRTGAGLGAGVRVTVGVVEVTLGTGPGGQLGERRLYPGRHRVSVRAGDAARWIGLVLTSLGGGAPIVDARLAWRGEVLSLGCGVDLVGGTLRLGVGIASPVRLLLERREDPLAGAWTGAVVTGQVGSP